MIALVVVTGGHALQCWMIRLSPPTMPMAKIVKRSTLSSLHFTVTRWFRSSERVYSTCGPLPCDTYRLPETGPLLLDGRATPKSQGS